MGLEARQSKLLRAGRATRILAAFSSKDALGQLGLQLAEKIKDCRKENGDEKDGTAGDEE